MTPTDFPPVPDRYRGVWNRTLLEAPGVRDVDTFVRWMQTPRWHADLRVPGEARGARVRPAQLAQQKGFCGVTDVQTRDGTETCAWHRLVDYQPPGPHPDIGRVVFETPDRLIETGIHAEYLEIWERVPGSTGRFVALESLPEAGAPPTRLLVAGRYAMRVRPRSAAWPPGLTTAHTLSDLVQDTATELLDFEISFGLLEGGRWWLQQSTLPLLEGSDETCAIHRVSDSEARVQGPAGEARWRVLDWEGTGDTLL